jgi:hypothetical protein
LSSSLFLSNLAERRGLTPRTLPARIRGDLDCIVLKSLDKDRERRYASASALAEDIQRHLHGDPVLAHPASAAYRARKFARRHGAAAFAGVLVTIAILAGSVLATVGMLKARASAERERQTASQATAVNDFMREVLTSASPDRDGADVRLVAVLDRAANTAAQRFADHPAQEAEVRDLLGAVYNNLSIWVQARDQFRLAMDLWNDVAGPEDPRSIVSEHNFCGSAINLLQTQEAARRLPGLMNRALAVFGPNHPTTLDIHRTQGLVEMLSGRLDEAEAIFQDVRTRTSAVAGDNDELQIRTLRSLISVGRKRSHSAPPELRARLVGEIAELTSEQLERAARAYGDDSLATLNARLEWAQVLADQRDYTAASLACVRVLEPARTRLGDCHFIVQEANDVLAHAAHRTGDSKTAARLLLEGIACVRTTRDELGLIVAISDALPILDRGERWSEGESLARELVDRLQAFGGGHDNMLVEAEAWVARFLSLQEQGDQADSLLRTLVQRPETNTLHSRVHARILLFHGGNLRRLGRFEESEVFLKPASSMLDDVKKGTLDSTPDDLLVELIALYHAWGKPERSREYEAERERATEPLAPATK